MRQQDAEQGVPRLVDGGDLLLLVGDDHRAPLGAHQHLVLGELEVVHRDELLVGARRLQRRLVHQVRQIGAGEAGGAARQHADVHVVGQRNLAGVHREDALAALDVRTVDDDPAVETARPQQRRIEHVRPVGGRHQDDAFVGLEAVHLDEQLVERLLALVVAAAQAGAAMTADRVDLVDEDDAGRVLLALLEQVAHARGADADEHLDEVGAADREERHVGLAGHGPRQQRLAGARRAHQQHALGDPAAELLELLRLLQELDDLLQLFLGLVGARRRRGRSPSSGPTRRASPCSCRTTSALLPPLWTCRMKKIQKPITSRMGAQDNSSAAQGEAVGSLAFDDDALLDEAVGEPLVLDRREAPEEFLALGRAR